MVGTVVHDENRKLASPGLIQSQNFLDYSQYASHTTARRYLHRMKGLEVNVDCSKSKTKPFLPMFDYIMNAGCVGNKN